MIGWKKVTTCPSCRSRDRHLIAQILYTEVEASKVAHLLEVPGGEDGIMIQAFLCRCGLAYTGSYPHPQDEYYKTVYPLVQEMGRNAYDIEIDQDLLERDRAERIVSGWQVPGIDEDTSLLDIGCGSGKFMELLNEKYGVQVSGVDIGDEYPDWEFDIITMIHSLEHMVDPVTFLLGIHKYIKKGGILFVEVPSLVQNTAGSLSINHPICFTRMSLFDTLHKADFMPEAIVQEVADGFHGMSLVLQAYARKL